MDLGRYAYRLVRGQSNEASRAVDIFEEADPSTVVTVEEQRAYVLDFYRMGPRS